MKKVEGLDESVSKNDIVFCTSNGESTRSLNSNLVDKSPRVMGFSDCVSLATPLLLLVVFHQSDDPSSVDSNLLHV